MARRRASAEMALNLSRAFEWDGPRRGFSSYVYGRLNVGADPGLALAAFNDAARIYAATPGMAIQSAHVAVQQAAFALSSGDPDTVLTLVDPAIPVAEGAQNAALLATLLMFRAEALGLQGRESEAETARLDSLAWARYGFGADVKVLERLRDVAMLRGHIDTCFGWRLHVSGDTRPTSLMNHPMQAHGAEMLRLACCLLTEDGIEVCAPVHDAVLIQAQASHIDEAVARTRHHMARAARIVLGGFEIRTDADVIVHPQRLRDDRGEAMWNTVAELLAGLDGQPRPM